MKFFAPLRQITVFFVGLLWISQFVGAENFDLPSGSVRYWLTSSDQEYLLAEQTPLKLIPVPEKSGAGFIQIDDQKHRQPVVGFGASMTESSASLIAFLPKIERDRLMEQLFGRSGIAISLLRQPMGAPDFALGIFSYDDVEIGQTDFKLAKFSIDRDRKYTIPLLKQALLLNPDLKIMASPWSPPAWMKTGTSMIGSLGGVLRTDCYQVYADYFVRFILAYQAEGISIYAVTPQNEIDYAPSAYPGMKWTAAEEAHFVRDYLGPALRKNGIQTKILGWDHNWDKPEFAIEMLSDPKTALWLAGTAWHWYGGSPDVMSRIHDRFPDKEIWFTEGGTGTWVGSGSFMSTFKDGMKKSLDIMSNWSQSIIFWNIALNEHNGPVVFPNTSNYGLVQINEASKTVNPKYRSSYYMIGQFSSFVQPGAWCVESPAVDVDVDHVAFVNPDGSHVLVLYNRYSSDQEIQVMHRGVMFSLNLPGESAASCIWKDN